MTDAQLEHRLSELAKIHPKEIGLRAGETVAVLRELKELRAKVASLGGNVQVDDDDAVNAAMARIREVVSEFSDNYVVIFEWMMDEETRTPSIWHGNFNACCGLAARMAERMRQKMIETDFPNDPPEGDDWKTGVEN